LIRRARKTIGVMRKPRPLTHRKDYMSKILSVPSSSHRNNGTATKHRKYSNVCFRLRNQKRQPLPTIIVQSQNMRFQINIGLGFIQASNSQNYTVQ